MKKGIRTSVWIICLSLAVVHLAIGQNTQEASSKKIKLPLIELNAGYAFLFSDNGFTTGLGGSNAQMNYQLSINQPVLPFLSVGLNLGTSTFSDDQMVGEVTNINYRSVVFTQDLSFYYELSNLFNAENGADEQTGVSKQFSKVQPYLGFGIGLVSFRAKGDLRDESGSAYHYWEDGSIRNISEADPNAEAAVLVMRDRSFESDLRDANLDGFGRYDQLAFRMPVEVGLRYQFTRNFGLNLKARYHMNFTDLIDNISVESTGGRAGNSANDNHLAVSLGITVFLGRHSKAPKPEALEPVLAKNKDDEEGGELEKGPVIEEADDPVSGTSDTSESDSEELDQAEERSSSVIAEEVAQSESLEEGKDLSTDTHDVTDTQANSEEAANEGELTVEPASISTREQHVEEEPRNNQELNSGVKEVDVPESASAEDEVENSMVSDPELEGEAGTELTVETVEKQEVTDSEPTVVTGAESIAEEQPKEVDIFEVMTGLEGTEPKEVGEYHWADINKDRYISADEVLHFIDLLFDGDSEYTIPMIHSLIEYYFDQD